MLENGDVFDSSINKKPLTLTLGAGQVIKGWDQGNNLFIFTISHC